ncbi:preprotein translocase subunit SecY [Vallitalea okinawensis]|uniref:preprotein translocase subunit SecY n=1 Tax=Vallitalea okinawensis TaxID=2078660 RepID=UPI000CFBEB67|nr:preprotein translocase subunit SecY [Vallitalea okinawensis]
MFTTVRNAFKIPDLRKKLLYTLMMFVVIRLGAAIPVPGINSEVMAQFFSGDNAFLGLMDAITGGSLAQMTIFAMGVVPYINASIIMNLLTIAIPKLEEMQKDGEDGRKKLAKATRYLTVALAAVQAFGITFGFKNYGIFMYDSLWAYFIAIVALTAGTAFLMWCGERLTENGIGNGMSLIIFVNIISRIPRDVRSVAASGEPITITIVTILLLAMVAFVVLLQSGERRIPVQYAKRVTGRKVYGGQSTHIPMKVNTAGVIPIIFASSLLTFPTILTSFFGIDQSGTWGTILHYLSYSESWTGAILYVLFIIFFAYFYTTITFNPIEIGNNMKKNGGFIPGIRPGKPTTDYLVKVLNHVVFVGAVGLAVVALVPIVLSAVFNVGQLLVGGTSLLIVVGVALESVKQIEAQMLMRHYTGFLN